MKLAEGIRKHGFKRWYERELMQSHAHLVLAFLSSIGLMAAFEGLFTFVDLADKLLDLISIVLCGAVGLWSIRRYLALLMQAEAAARQAECPGCGTYACFALVQAHGSELQVRCCKCERVWPISE